MFWTTPRAPSLTSIALQVGQAKSPSPRRLPTDRKRILEILASPKFKVKSDVFLESVFFIQISDLHFCEETIENRDRRNLLQLLELALQDYPGSPVIVCGDVTHSGKRREYRWAWTYLHSRLSFGQFGLDAGPGLEIPRDALVAVPGTHDHCCGRPLPFRARFDPLICASQFKPLPSVCPIPISPSVELQLLRLDSNSGKAHLLNLRQGSIKSLEWGRLGDQVRQRTSESSATFVLRVLVLHHSLRYVAGGLQDAWPLVDSSQKELRDFVEKYGVAAVLTGHTHDVLRHEVHEWNAPNGSSCKLHELRSAATLVDTESQPAGFLRHELDCDERMAPSPVDRNPI